MKLSFLTALAMSALPLQAEDVTDKEAFIDANIRTVFYHELGHAVIDLMGVPIFGQEEDAADVMAVLLIDWLYDEDAAQSIAYDSAFGYISDPEGKDELAYWDLHGPDEQRYFNHICLFYGANPDEREELAKTLGLPDARAETCPDEYAQAANSWSAVFEEMDAQKDGVPMAFVAGTGSEAEVVNRIFEAEVAAMNADLRLPEKLTVKVENCGEANAYYDPKDTSVTFCSEFVTHLGELYEFHTYTPEAALEPKAGTE